MISYFEALEILKTSLSEIFQDCKTESVLIEDSLGRVLAEDIISDIDQPSFDTSAMDGIAVFSMESPWKLVGEIRAGDSKEYILSSNECFSVMTGTRIPENTFSVIPIEEIILKEGFYYLKTDSQIKPKVNIRFQGEDLKKSEITIPKFSIINSSMISTIATCGYSNLLVKKKLNVSIFATGDELIIIDKIPVNSEVRASNLYSLSILAKERNLEVIRKRILIDEKDSIKKAILEASLDSDLILTTGGISMGKFDLIPEVLNELGAKTLINKTNIKPGKPFLYNILIKNNKITPIVSFPGNPVSSFVTFVVYLIPSLNYAITGTKFQKKIFATTSETLRKKDSKLHFLRGNIFLESEINYFKKTKGDSSADMNGLGNSNVLGIFPESKNLIEIGEKIECILL
ncbi:MAG: molybdopterin molybdotransferase MoeA [Leptospiraceae bacterium]|nr:molybdopterin molybdotransferase MoeA [Leptospiraceae bacterium]